MKSDSNHLRQWRLMKGWTQQEVANRTGVTKGEMSRLEAGNRKLTVDWLNRFAKVYGVTTEDILSPPPSGYTSEPIKKHRSDSVDYVGTMRVTISGGDYMLVGAAGDEMSPTVQTGDRVIVDKEQNKLTAAGLFAVRMGDEVVIRRLQLIPGGQVNVSCDNRDYVSVAVDVAEIPVVGRVVARIHRL